MFTPHGKRPRKESYTAHDWTMSKDRTEEILARYKIIGPTFKSQNDVEVWLQKTYNISVSDFRENVNLHKLT